MLNSRRTNREARERIGTEECDRARERAAPMLGGCGLHDRESFELREGRRRAREGKKKKHTAKKKHRNEEDRDFR